MLFWNDNDVRALGVVLGQHFAEGQLDSLADLLDEAAGVYGAIHSSAHDPDDLRQLAESIRKGEKLGRYDHPLRTED